MPGKQYREYSDESTGRSYAYQDSLRQSTYSELEWKTIYQLLPSIESHLTELIKDNEYIQDCEEQLADEFMLLLMKTCSVRQITIATGILRNQTYAEIGEELGINQTSVTKVLRGNMDYQAGEVYGGLNKKMVKEVLKSSRIQKIMKEIYITGPQGCNTVFYTTFISNCFNNFHEFTLWLGETI